MVAARSFLIAAILMCGCQQQNWQLPEVFHPRPKDPAAAMIADMEDAHGLSEWSKHKAVAADLVIIWHDKTVLAGTLSFTTDARKSRLEINDGPTLVFDG